MLMCLIFIGILEKHALMPDSNRMIFSKLRNRFNGNETATTDFPLDGENIHIDSGLRGACEHG